MNKFNCPVLAACRLVLTVAFVSAANGGDKVDPHRLKDFTNIKLEEIGVKLVQAKKDAKTGFVVGGKNATALIKSLTEINGRSIDALEKEMVRRPTSEAGSTQGFLGLNERLLDVLAEDNRFVVDEKGLTHQELAKHLLALAAIGGKFKNQEFLYHGRRYKVTGLDFQTGAQSSPFRDGTDCGGLNPTVHNLDNGKKIQYSLLVPKMIERYGFYEGKGTNFRVAPRQILAVFDFLDRKDKLNMDRLKDMKAALADIEAGKLRQKFPPFHVMHVEIEHRFGAGILQKLWNKSAE